MISGSANVSWRNRNNFSLHLRLSHREASVRKICFSDTLNSKIHICIIAQITSAVMQNYLVQWCAAYCDTYITPLEGKVAHCKVQHTPLKFLREERCFAISLLRYTLPYCHSYNSFVRFQADFSFCVFACAPLSDLKLVGLSWRKVTSLHANQDIATFNQHVTTVRGLFGHCPSTTITKYLKMFFFSKLNTIK